MATENQRDFDVLLTGMMELIQDDLKTFTIDEMGRQGLIEERVSGEYVVTEAGLEAIRDLSQA